VEEDENGHQTRWGWGRRRKMGKWDKHSLAKHPASFPLVAFPLANLSNGDLTKPEFGR